MEDIGGFYIVWLDDEGDPIADSDPEWPDEWLDRTSLHSAVRSIALRIRQSPHLCPPNVAGFVLMRSDTWQSRNTLGEDRQIEVDPEVLKDLRNRHT